MKARTTLLLATFAGGFLAYIWLVERHTLSTQERADTATRVLNMEQDKITFLSIQNADIKLELRKKNGVWHLEQPMVDRADGLVVSQLLGTLESLQHTSRIEIPTGQETEKLKEFGVADSALRIKVKVDSGKESELLLGKDSAIEGKLYVRQQGANTVFVIANNLRSQLLRKPDEFRDKRLSDTPAQQVIRLSVKTPEGELEVERKNNHWEIVKPLRARASDQKINDLLAGVLTAKIAQFLPETPTLEQGLGEPHATISLTLEGQKEIVTLKVGSAPPGPENKDRSFTRFSNRPAVTVLANSVLDPLLKARPNDVRDHKLVRVESDIVDRITLEPADQPKIVLTRKGEGWVQKDGEHEIRINESIATKLLSDIQATEVTNFVSDVATDLAKYGLEHPRMKLTLSSYASENTAETRAGERPIVTVLFGAVEGDNGYAKLEDEPFILASPRAFLEALPSHSAQLQPLGVFDFKPESVVSLEVVQEGVALKLERNADVWKLIGSDGLPNEINLREVLRTLSSLRATRWLAPWEAGEAAEEKPTLTLTLALKDGEKSSASTLTFGRPLGAEGYYAKVSGKTGAFLLSKTDWAALKIKLVQ